MRRESLSPKKNIQINKINTDEVNRIEIKEREESTYFKEAKIQIGPRKSKNPIIEAFITTEESIKDQFHLKEKLIPKAMI